MDADSSVVVSCAGMCTMMDLLHSKTSTHLEDGLNQQSNSTTKKNVVISIIVTDFQFLCIRACYDEHAQ